MSTFIVNVANAAEDPSQGPINSDFIAYMQNKTAEQVIGGHGTGNIPSIVNLSHFTPIIKPLVSFPASYDLRTLNKVTPVRDQGGAGSCWAHATYGSLESYLMPTSWDFSENNMKNVLSSAAPQGFDRGPQDGGNAVMSAAYLNRWSGPVGESVDPYSDTSIFTPAELSMPTQQHVQNVYYLPTKTSALDNDQIKSALQIYGGIYTSFQIQDPYYNSATYSYYDPSVKGGNHAVTIVGWDDNYDKNKFSIVPPGNGAFIVKNSWGTAWGDKGYFYVSYYDINFGYNSNAVFTSESINDYKNIYQYDPLGWVESWGSGSGLTAWGANVFTATSNDPLEAVGFYTTDSNCNYNFYISSSSNLNTRTLVKSGTFTYAGYHTIQLSSPISLTTGQKFSVIVQLTNPSSSYPWPIAAEDPYPGYSSKATANAGESFFSSDGSNWVDMTAKEANTNICIKAFTGAVGSIPTVTGLSPNYGPAAGGNLVIITGTGFTGASAVKFGSATATYTVVSATQINATAPAGTGIVDVNVTTTNGTSVVSANSKYTYNAAPVAPTVTGLNPTNGPAAGGNLVIITGTGFTGASAVKFGSATATYTVVSATQINATAPAGTGIVDVNVTTTNGTSVVSANSKYTYTKPFPGYTKSPTDLNNDGLYEDINGNGQLDFDDVVAYYDNMDWIQQNNLTAYFDYNRNGQIDFDDVVKLYDML